MMEPSSSPDSLVLRPATVADAPGIIALVDGVYREYGDRTHLDEADRDLLSLHNFYPGGEFVVLVDDERVVGLHGVVPLETPSLCTFRRLYLLPELRGSGWGEKLMRWAIDRAAELGFARVEFWSDTRFVRAHAFFQRLGFVKDGRTRTMHDSWEPYSEYFFYRELGA